MIRLAINARSSLLLGRQSCANATVIMGEIQCQLKRSFILIPLNIAEGSGKQSGKDQARFLRQHTRFSIEMWGMPRNDGILTINSEAKH